MSLPPRVLRAIHIEHSDHDVTAVVSFQYRRQPGETLSPQAVEAIRQKFLDALARTNFEGPGNEGMTKIDHTASGWPAPTPEDPVDVAAYNLLDLAGDTGCEYAVHEIVGPGGEPVGVVGICMGENSDAFHRTVNNFIAARRGRDAVERVSKPYRIDP